MSWNTRRLPDRANELMRNTQHFAILAPRFARKISTSNPPSHAEGTYPRNCMVEQPSNKSQKCIPVNSQILRHFSVGKRVSRQKYVPIRTFPEKLCEGSKKWRRSIRWTVLRRCNRLKIASTLEKIIMNPYLKKKVSLEEQKAQIEDRFLRGRQDSVFDLRILSGDWSA